MTKLRHQPQPFQLSCVLRAGGHQVNSGGVDGRMTQNVRQLHDIAADFIKCRGKQVAEVMREDLRAFDPGFFAQRFHLPPDLFAGDGLTASGEKYFSGGGLVFPGVLEQLPAELRRKQDGPDLAFQADLRPAGPRGFDRDLLDLRYPDAGSADGFHAEPKALLSLRCRGIEKTLVFGARQLPVLLPERLSLDAEELDLAVLPAQEPKQRIDGGEHGVDGSGGAALLDQMLPPCGGVFFIQLPAPQPRGKFGGVMEVFADGAGGTVFAFQADSKVSQRIFHYGHRKLSFM